MTRPVRAAWSVSIAGLSFLLVVPAAAQSVVRGRVVSDSGGAPIDGAEVLVVAPARSARSDPAGRFELADLPGGIIALRIRAVGFKPLELDAEVGAADTVEVELRLTPAAQRLPTLTVREPPARPASGKMETFEERRRAGFGKFLTRAELSKWENTPLSVPLRRLSNLRLVPRTCGGGYAIATGRGGEVTSECGADPHACYLAVFVDGLLLWPGQPGPPNVDDYVAAGIQGIELYRGPGELPAELQQTGTECGALVIWTRTGESDRPAGQIRPISDDSIQPLRR